MNPLQLPRYIVTEVHNYGGFFGGDTVTLSAQPAGAAGDELTLVIDEKALENVSERHKIVPGMVLALKMDGERVDHAWVLSAAQHEELRAALGPVTIAGPLDKPVVLSKRCPSCERWTAREYLGAGQCPACGAACQL